MRVKLVTWNVNSVRARMAAVEKFCKAENPDILCLQETKVLDGSFPLAPFRDMGFEHHALYGQKAYHGVAIFARKDIPLEKITRKEWCGIEQARHIYCRIGDNVELHNFYVPAGGDEPDPELNDKFAHKLNFMAEVSSWFKRRKRKTNRFVLVGDLNVAPHENDVWGHKQLLKVVSHTPVEVAAMQTWYDSHDWVDAVRHFIPTDERLYSWWSYRAKDWRAADRGRRLDHVWVTPALRDSLHSAQVIRDARGYDKASDHAPIIIELDIG